MCLAIPGKIKSLSGTTAKVDFGGVARDVAVDLLPQAKTGDYVVVHAGFAIQLLDEKEAEATLELFREIYGQQQFTAEDAEDAKNYDS